MHGSGLAEMREKWLNGQVESAPVQLQLVWFPHSMHLLPRSELQARMQWLVQLVQHSGPLRIGEAVLICPRLHILGQVLVQSLL